jgi:hypothetical protein
VQDVQKGRPARPQQAKEEAYRVPIAPQNAVGERDVEFLSVAITREAGTRLAGFFNILLGA